MNAHSIRAAFFALTLLSWPSEKTFGELITFRFDGNVTVVDDTIPQHLGGPFDDWPELGTPVSGYYRFDSTAVDISAPGSGAIYLTVLADGAISIRVGDFQWDGNSVGISAYTSVYEVGDGLPHITLTTHPDRAQLLDRNSFRMQISEPGLLPNTDFPLIPPSVTESAFFEIVLDRSGNFGRPYVVIGGTVESLTIVPEPSTATMFICASTYLCFFFSFVRKRPQGLCLRHFFFPIRTCSTPTGAFERSTAD